jgi:holliday junction DNA helicase RuvA
MISWLSGKIIHKERNFIILNVGGVGYKVNISVKTFSSLENKDEAEFYTYQNVHEDILDLYGFLSFDELQFFEAILSVSGIGPKVGLSILGEASVGEIKSAVAREDILFFNSIPGIGKKTAERFIIEIRNKIETIALSAGEEGGDNSDVVEALAQLGYSRKEALDIVKQIPKNIESEKEKITWALKNLGKDI